MKKIYIFLMSLFVIFFFSSLHVVQEGYQGILLRFGNIVYDKQNKPIIYMPGAYFRLPCIEDIKNLDTRIHTTNYLKHAFFIKKHNFFIVEYYVKWKIRDSCLYYLNTDHNIAYSLNTILKNQLNLVRKTDFLRLSVQDGITNIKRNFFENIYITKKFAQLGIDIIDIGIKRVKFSHDFTKCIYDKFKNYQEYIAMNQFLKGTRIFKKNILFYKTNIINVLLKKYQLTIHTKKLFCILKNYNNIFKFNIL